MQIILHVGQQKTASSTIQTYLSHDREQLAFQKLLYPRAFGEVKATHIVDFLADKPPLGTAREKISHDLKAEFLGDYSRAIISNENLFTTGAKALQELENTFKPYATSWRILCYLRRPDEHITSQYQQKVKGGYVDTFERFFEERLNDPIYLYSQWMDGWASVFGQDAIEARVFHRTTLQGNPVDDFTQWVGFERMGLSAEVRENVKESFDRLNTEIIRFLFLCQIERPDLVRRHNMKRMLHRLRSLDTGTRQRLDTERANRLQQRFREDHEQLARRYLPPEHAAVLLAPPAEVPLQPSLDRDELFRRMMTLFQDPDLAHLAVERAEQPSDHRRAPGKRLRAEKGQRVRGARAARDSPPSEKEKEQPWLARILRRVRNQWQSR